MKKTVFLTALLFTLCSIAANSQYYNRQAGLRSGTSGGIFIQYSDASGTAENGFFGMLSFRKNGLQVTGLRIFYETSLSEVSPDLYFTWGYGGHAGFMITDHLSFLGEEYYLRGERFCPLIGIDGWAGLEYRFQTIPLSLGLNLKPWLEITFPSFISFMPVDLGMTIAYRF
ncbi:MAG: hypothetical protein IH591_08035 [Bacteroidales bacterium]|nr:hypothetical protein [Bacteroidales bacterium]